MFYLETINFLERELLIIVSEKGLVYFGDRSQGLMLMEKSAIPYCEMVTPYSTCLKDFLCQYERTGISEISVKCHQVFGTSFQRKVWEALADIPNGQSSSYQEIAKKIGSPRATQAVGTAIGKNPWLIVVPCHRVLRKTREIGGLSSGLPLKRELLRLEKIPFKENSTGK